MLFCFDEETMMTITCIHCKQELPESSFYPSSLERGWRICKKCQNQKQYISNKKYFLQKRETTKQAEEQAEKDAFEKVFGGYTIIILNSSKKNEFRYAIKGTDGTFLQTNNPNVFKEKFLEVFNRSQNASE